MTITIELPVKLSKKEEEILKVYILKKVWELKKIKKMFNLMDKFVLSLDKEDKDLFSEYLKEWK